MRHWQTLFTVVVLLDLAVPCPALAREIHVAPNGSDVSEGTVARPCGTISFAASMAQPGDMVIVHGGTYREWVKPPRGGTSDEQRIVYRAAPGEEVWIKGSERITSWRDLGDGLWETRLPNSFFGEYNPYALKLSGGWLNYGKWHTRGDVYLDGEAFEELQTLGEVSARLGTWCASVNDQWTVIRANFGEVDPNRQVAEINVRESLFFPDVPGLRYITVDGFKFAHAAVNWAPPVIELQTGAVGTRMGKGWVIENCSVVNARCVGIILGQAPGVDYEDIDAYGDHVVRNNHIRRCGQAGIAGQKGATRSLITGNLIEETNYRREFGGWETAAIKFHNSVDTVISNNLIRGVYHQKEGAFGIWIDFGNQGVRICRNIIYDTQAATVFLEMNHGPTLVDNNVLVGQDVRSNSEATVFAQNLFVDCGYVYRSDVRRRSQYFKPHTTIVAGRKTGTARDERWHNNIFVRRGLDSVKPGPGHRSDHNVFLAGAAKSTFGDEHSLASADDVSWAMENRSAGVDLRFSLPKGAARIEGPRVDAILVGRFSTVGQTIEDRHGTPLSVDYDLRGEPFRRYVVGPLADLKPGANEFSWTLSR